MRAEGKDLGGDGLGVGQIRDAFGAPDKEEGMMVLMVEMMLMVIPMMPGVMTTPVMTIPPREGISLAESPRQEGLSLSVSFSS